MKKIEVEDKTEYMQIVMEGGLDDDMFESVLDRYISLQVKYNSLVDNFNTEQESK